MLAIQQGLGIGALRTPGVAPPSSARSHSPRKASASSTSSSSPRWLRSAQSNVSCSCKQQERGAVQMLRAIAGPYH